MALTTFANQSGEVPASELDDNFDYLLGLIENGPRTRLTGDTTYYVRTDGNNSNDGLTNTAAGAFATPQGAVDRLMQSVDIAGYQVNIDIADGTYPNVLIAGPFVGAGNAQLVQFLGNVSNPQNVIIQGTGADALEMRNNAAILLSGITFTTTGSGFGWHVQHSYVQHKNCRFLDCVQDMMVAQEVSVISAIGPLEVAGDSISFIHCTGRSRMSFETQDVTFTGTPAFSTYVVGLNDSTCSFASGNLIGDKTGRVFVHISATLNLSSVGDGSGGKGDIFGTNSGPEIDGGGIIIWDSPRPNTLYVRSDGSDNNDGYTNTAERAFLTPAAAIAFLQRRPYDPGNSRTPTIKIGPGTWTTRIDLKNVGGFIDYVILEGDTATPGNVIISTTGNAILASGISTHWVVQGFKLTTATSGDCIAATAGSWVSFNSIEFGACAGSHVEANRGAYIENGGNYTVSGGAVQHLLADSHATINVATGTATLSGTPAFSSFTVRATMGAYIRATPTWSGGATGTRYLAQMNAVIDVNGGGANAIPGNGAGSTATGGQYA